MILEQQIESIEREAVGYVQGKRYPSKQFLKSTGTITYWQQLIDPTASKRTPTLFHFLPENAEYPLIFTHTFPYRLQQQALEFLTDLNGMEQTRQPIYTLFQVQNHRKKDDFSIRLVQAQGVTYYRPERTDQVRQPSLMRI